MIKTVSIKGNDYKVRQTLRAMFLFEEITRRPFKVETMLDNMLYLYCIILAGNPGNVISWDEFIDAADEDPEIITAINTILSETRKVESLLEDDQEEGDCEAQKKS